MLIGICAGVNAKAFLRRRRGGSGCYQDERWRGFCSLDRDDCVAPLASAVITADDFDDAVFAVLEFELMRRARVTHAELHASADAISNRISANFAFESLYGCEGRGLIEESQVKLREAFGLGGEGEVA